MALLNSLNTEPPDGWKFLEARTGQWIKADLLDELADLVIAHRQHKNLDRLDKAEVLLEIQRQICLGASKGVCRAEKGEDYRPFQDQSRALSLYTIGSVSSTLVAWMKAGLNMVSPAESAERAAICRGCPFNKTPSGCVCTPFWKLIDSIVPKERKEPGMYICTLCGCSLAAKVLAPMDVVRDGNPTDLRLPEWCWQRAAA